MTKSIGIGVVANCIAYSFMALTLGLLVCGCIGYYGFGITEGTVYNAGRIGSLLAVISTTMIAGSTLYEKLA